MSKRAIILAGGRGTRLYPYTLSIPKPLIPLGDIPILEIIIRQLSLSGFNWITLAVNHQAELIKEFFKDGSRWNIKIDYSLESKPLSTMGPLRLINNLPEDFLVMNGDILTDLDFAEMYDDHVSENRTFTVAAHKRTNKIDYGVLESDSNDYLIGFKEKPQTDYLVSMGVYLASKKILDLIPDGELYGFDHLMRDLMSHQKKVKINVYDGYWLDIGRPDDYEAAIKEFDGNKKQFLKEF